MQKGAQKSFPAYLEKQSCWSIPHKTLIHRRLVGLAGHCCVLMLCTLTLFPSVTLSWPQAAYFVTYSTSHSLSLSLCLLPGTNTDHGRQAHSCCSVQLCPLPLSLSLSTHLCLAWMKSLSFWNSVKPQMENYFTSLFQQDCVAGLLTPALRREGRGRAEGKEEGGRTTAPNWHEAERQWKTPMASLPYEFMSALLPLIGHSSIVLRRLSQSASPNQTAALGSGVRMSFYGWPYVQHHVLLLTTSASMQNSLNLHFGLVLE